MRFSVVIPTHNRLHLLRDAVETVRRQEFAEWELVVFDNASDDPVCEHVQSLKDDRLRYVRSDEFLPVTCSWNRAIDLARGDYVILLGDDDGLTPRYFTRLQQIIERFDAPEVVYNNIYQFWHPGVAPWEPSGYLIEVKHGFFFANREEPFRLTEEEAVRAALGSIRLKINFSFNSQAFIYNRKFLARLSTDGPIYRSPFPDYYIANVALVRSRSTVVVPEPLAVAGVSKASFGFTMYNQEDDRGAALLNVNLSGDAVYREIESHLLPGPAYNTNFVVAMEYVARALPQLGQAVDFRRYRRAQIFALVERRIRGELSEVDWADFFSHLALSERLWAWWAWRVLYVSGRFRIVERLLLSKVKKSATMSGSNPMVRHCGKHNFSRVTDLYDALVSGALS
jgi:glycosyltransferase involved in cell wall biosynthesis